MKTSDNLRLAALIAAILLGVGAQHWIGALDDGQSLADTRDLHACSEQAPACL